jgi:hypothetical protein
MHFLHIESTSGYTGHIAGAIPPKAGYIVICGKNLFF